MTLGLNLSGCGEKPVPVTGTLVGDPVALCIKTMLPETAPARAGANVTVNVWLVEGASVPLAGDTVN